jgi:hypothetical protein
MLYLIYVSKTLTAQDPSTFPHLPITMDDDDDDDNNNNNNNKNNNTYYSLP